MHTMNSGMGQLSRYGDSLRAGLDGPGIGFWSGRGFSHPSAAALGPTQTPVQWVTEPFPGVKRPRRGVDHPPPSTAEFKKEYAYTCTPLPGLHGRCRVNFAFYEQ